MKYEVTILTQDSYRVPIETDEDLSDNELTEWALDVMNNKDAFLVDTDVIHTEVRQVDGI